MKKETIQKVINFVITVLTAVLSAFCVQSFGVSGNLSPTDVFDQALSNDLGIFAGSCGVAHLVFD